MSESNVPRVVIVGCGFGGLTAARALKRTPVEVVVIDKKNYHLFQPLLYQVASAALTPAEIAVPIRGILRRQKNALVVLAEVTGVDLANRRVLMGEEELRFDYLILAAGAVDNYFGNDGWGALAPGLKSLESALDMRSRMLLSFESAELETSEAARKALLTFVVIGGGPTGVEMAGAIKELAVDVISADFRFADTRNTRVVLIEAGPRLLPGMHPKSSDGAKAQLERMGVEVLVGQKVTEITPLGVHVGDGFIASRNVIWGAGIRAHPLGETLGQPKGPGGRVPVGPDLTLPGQPNVFVVGDLAAVKDLKNSGLVPGVAQGAIQMGRYAARSIQADVAGRKRPGPFAYHDKGTMATIGRSRAVADIGGWHPKGLLAWLAWSLVHVAVLIGFRNRVVTLLSWIQSYFFFHRGSRLIVGNRSVDLVKPMGDAEVSARARASVKPRR